MESRIGRHLLALLGIGAAACGSAGDSERALDSATTDSASPPASTPDRSTLDSGTSVGTTAGVRGVSGCSGESVDRASVVALDAADGSLCWSALPDRYSFVAAATENSVIAGGASCDALNPSITAVDRASGAVLWEVEWSGEGMIPFVAGDVLVVGGGGTTKAIEMATGGARWAVPGEPLGGSPDLAVVRDPSPSAAVIHAVDAATGEARWEADVSGDVDTAVGLGSGDADADVVVLPAGVSLVAYDASSGVLRWHRPLPAGLDASTSPQVLLVDGTAVLVDSATGSGLTGFDAATGDQRWAITSSPPSFLLPDADAIYLQPPAQNQPGFGRLDPDTGEPRWSVAAPAALYQGYGGSGMAAVATDMWPMTTTAAVDAIDAETGAVR